MVPRINRIFCDWYGFERPVIAAVNGHAVAGGLILALCADYRVGSEGGPATASPSSAWCAIPGRRDRDREGRALATGRAPARAGGEPDRRRDRKEWDVVDELLPGAQVLARSLEVAHEYANLPTTTTRRSRTSYEAWPSAGCSPNPRATVQRGLAQRRDGGRRPRRDRPGLSARWRGREAAADASPRPRLNTPDDEGTSCACGSRSAAARFARSPRSRARRVRRWTTSGAAGWRCCSSGSP